MGSAVADAGTVRSVKVDSMTMAQVNLRLGESTVLRFPEKPKKVILGNSNYYAVEFVDNDVAIQPQSAIPTNLFVYGVKNVYGFLLKTSAGGTYDDLVHVSWKDPAPAMRAVTTPMIAHETSRPGLSIVVGGIANFVLEKIQRINGADSYIFDFTIFNVESRSLSLHDLRVEVMKGKKSFSPGDLVLKSERLLPGESTKARLIVGVKKQSGLLLEIRLLGSHQGRALPEKLL